MFNVTGEIKGDKLLLTIDLSPEARVAAQPSQSGKTRLIASTKGFVRFGDVQVSVNCTIKPEKP